MDLLGKLKSYCYSNSTESQHHYSLMSLRDFTISLQFSHYLDITLVSVTGTCQSPFTQQRMVKLICKLNESPEISQEYLPQARLLVMLSRGASSITVPHSAHFVTTVCKRGHLMKNGAYLFQSALALHLSPHETVRMIVLLSSPEPLQIGKEHRKTDFPWNIICFYAVCYSHPGEGGNHFLQWKGIGKKKHLYYNHNILFYTARNSRNSPSPAGFRKEDSTEGHRPIFISSHPTPRAPPWSSTTPRDAVLLTRIHPTHTSELRVSPESPDQHLICPWKIFPAVFLQRATPHSTTVLPTLSPSPEESRTSR